VTIASDARFRLAKKARVRWDTRSQKYMLLYPERGLLLNDVAARVVALCDGKSEWSQIVEALSREFPDVERSVLVDDVTTFAEKLRARGLLEIAS
jgi:coenzyme PQQ biosynthesis protein PqqD